MLYYQVVISSDEHTNIPNNIIITTGLTNVFLDLRSNTFYTITVIAVNKAGIGMSLSITVNTAEEHKSVSTGSDSMTNLQSLRGTKSI